jgi:hypothetical protein
VVMHVGAHLIAWTPRVPWGEMKMTRQAVMEGVEYIMHVVDQDEEWLRGTIICLGYASQNSAVPSKRDPKA